MAVYVPSLALAATKAAKMVQHPFEAPGGK